MTDYWVGEATPADVEAVAADLRPQDLREIAATSTSDACTAVRQAFEVSRKTWAGRVDEATVCLIGICTPELLSGRSYPWFYGTNKLLAHRSAFLRRAKPFARMMHEEAGTLVNWVDVRNRKAILWLGWMGFKVDVSKEIPWPATGQNFYRYSFGEPS